MQPKKGLIGIPHTQAGLVAPLNSGDLRSMT